MKWPVFPAADRAPFGDCPSPARLLSRILFVASLFTGPPLQLDGAETAKPVRPNILFIVADDLGYGELGCYGGRDIPTPNLDRLAGEGVRFTSAYVTASFCAPSRAALLTGRYQTRFGFEGNPVGAANADPRIGLPLTERTLADFLRDAGYATGVIGKWHLGGTAPYHPRRRGFDEFFGFLHEGHSYVPPPAAGVTSWFRRPALPDGSQGRWTSPDGRTIWSNEMGRTEPEYDADNPILRESQPVDERAYLTDAFTVRARDFIRRHAAQPFFLYLAYNAVHSPMQASDPYLARFAHLPDIHRRIFAAMLAQLDDSIGAVLAQLRESGLEQNTLVVFLSDNGGPTRELTSSNAPLRGEKGQLFEGGIRVPLILRWPGHVTPATSDQPIISMDATVTALAAAGVHPADGTRDGQNLVPAPPDAERILYWRTGPRAAMRQGKWKLVREPVRGQPGPWQLYDLASDLSEKSDLAPNQPDRLAQLVATWEKWSAAQAAPRW